MINLIIKKNRNKMPQILQGDKMSNLATKPKFALAALIGLIAGVV